MRSIIIIAIIIGIICQIVSSNISLSMSFGLFALILGIVDEGVKKQCEQTDEPDKCRLVTMVIAGAVCGILFSLLTGIPTSEEEISGAIIGMAGIAIVVLLGKSIIEEGSKPIQA